MAILLCYLALPSLLVSVRDFGAVGDGVTDDFRAINAALANMSTSGGVLHFPAPGAYAISKAIRVGGFGITLRGDGMVPHPSCDYGSSLLALSTSNSTLVVFENCRSCVLEQIGLHGANSAAAGSCAEAHTNAAAVLRARSTRRRQRGLIDAAGVISAASAASAGMTKPTNGAAVVVRRSFQITVSYVWIANAFAHVALSEFANTVTMADMQLTNAFGPCAICVAGALLPPVGLSSADTDQTRVDILQITRLTANNGPPHKAGHWPGGNTSTIWLDIGGGVNTVRLDNVGFLNGGTSVRMDSGSTEPAGIYPGRPLFLFVNDLEIDNPSGNALELLRGEEVQLSNCYIQGAGSTDYVDRRANDSSLGVGLRVEPSFSSEIMVTNSRFFGHALSAIVLAGGAHTTISNNVMTENSIAKSGLASGIVVHSGVSDFIIQGNHIGTLSTTTSTTAHGIDVHRGASDRYVITANTLTGNVKGGLRDLGEGKAKSVVGNVL